MTVNQRIALIVEKSGLKITAYSRLLDISQPSLRDIVMNISEPRFSTIVKIIRVEPLISIEWLIMGDGAMYRSDNKDVYKDRYYKAIEKIVELQEQLMKK